MTVTVVGGRGTRGHVLLWPPDHSTGVVGRGAIAKSWYATPGAVTEPCCRHRHCFGDWSCVRHNSRTMQRELRSMLRPELHTGRDADDRHHVVAIGTALKLATSSSLVLRDQSRH